MKVAVIGAGIAGLGAALGLSGAGAQVTLYERDARLGGHAHTIDVDYDGRAIAVDTGFIVYNELNYPNFTAMLDWLGVETIASDMSFALSSDDGAFEWCGQDRDTFSGLFAQRRNLVSPAFLRFLAGVRRFQSRARADIAAGAVGEEALGAYLAARGVGARVRDDYIVPMSAAIWSMTPGDTLAFPARSFLAFFENHKLLQWDRPVWRTVKGGSRAYVRAALARLNAAPGFAARVGAAVTSVRREGGQALVEAGGEVERFDAAIVATHAPTALALLVDADAHERDALSAFRVSANHVVVHRDAALMPRRRAAWASWSVLRRGREGGAAVTYWMNRLQSIPNETPLFITLNPDRAPRADAVFARFAYDHPIYDAAAIAAQARLPAVQGANRVSFAGAWTGYGFHEDGLASGLAAARGLGGTPPWRA